MTATYVNGEKIDDGEIRAEAERLRPHHDDCFADVPPEERERQLQEWSRENVIERVLLRQAALRDPGLVAAHEVESAYRDLMAREVGPEGRYPEAEAERAIKEDLESRLRVDRLLERIAEGVPAPAEADLRAYYEAHGDRFAGPETVRASHIVKHVPPEDDGEAARRELEEVLGALRGGAEFGALARAHSDCPERDGDLGFFPRGHMVDAFDDVVFALHVGDTSDVFRTEFGYHIARVTDRRPAGPRPFEEARDDVAREVSQERSQKALEDFLDAERARATIEEK